jgi:hypothetical protein
MAPASSPSSSLSLPSLRSLRRAALEVAGERLLARGLALAPGARAGAVLTTPRGQTLTLRFVLR